MIPHAHLNWVFLVMLWAAAATGLLLGAQVGYHAVDAENATMEYDGANQKMTVASHNMSVYGCTPDDELFSSEYGLKPATEESLIELSGRGEKWLGDDDGSSCEGGDMDTDDILPPHLADRADQYAMQASNLTMSSAFAYVAIVGDHTASIVYEHRDGLSWQTVQAIIYTVIAAPPLAVAYIGYRRARG